MKIIDGAWHCVACQREVYAPGRKGIPHHSCPKLGGLMAPMVPVGQHAGIRAIVREDYSQGQTLQLNDEGKAVMAIVVTREEGQDCSVLAPVASVRGSVLMPTQNETQGEVDEKVAAASASALNATVKVEENPDGLDR